MAIETGRMIQSMWLFTCRAMKQDRCSIFTFAGSSTYNSSIILKFSDRHFLLESSLPKDSPKFPGLSRLDKPPYG
jgi:hypothetical protein